MIFLTMLFTLTLCSSQSADSSLTPLFKIDGSYIDKEEHNLIIPKYNLKVDERNNLYHNGKTIFTPDGEYNYCIYELYNENYIIITAISDSMKNSSALYILPKNWIRIISLSDIGSVYELNLNGKLICGIDMKKGFLLAENHEKKKIEKLKLSKVK